MPLTFRRLAPFMDRVPYRASRRVAAFLGTGDTLLDVGGGTGRVASHYRAAFRRVVVADVERAMLARAREKGLEVVLADARHLPFRDGAAEGAILVDALHHIPEQDAALREAARSLAPGGRLAVEEFDPTTFGGAAVRFLEFMLRFGSHFHSPDELRKFLEASTGLPAHVVFRKGKDYAVGAARPR